MVTTLYAEHNYDNEETSTKILRNTMSPTTGRDKPVLQRDLAQQAVYCTSFDQNGALVPLISIEASLRLILADQDASFASATIRNFVDNLSDDDKDEMGLQRFMLSNAASSSNRNVALLFAPITNLPKITQRFVGHVLRTGDLCSCGCPCGVRLLPFQPLSDAARRGDLNELRTLLSKITESTTVAKIQLFVASSPLDSLPDAAFDVPLEKPAAPLACSCSTAGGCCCAKTSVDVVAPTPTLDVKAPVSCCSPSELGHDHGVSPANQQATEEANLRKRKRDDEAAASAPLGQAVGSCCSPSNTCCSSESKKAKADE